MEYHGSNIVSVAFRRQIMAPYHAHPYSLILVPSGGHHPGGLHANSALSKFDRDVCRAEHSFLLVISLCLMDFSICAAASGSLLTGCVPRGDLLCLNANPQRDNREGQRCS